jgi:uncharacterized protein (TIGR02646 family)
VRKIKIQPPDTPAWKRWDKKCKNATKLNWEKVDRNEKPIFDGEIYKKYKDFFMDTAFDGRCGYCECLVKDFQHGDVEHFRPKAPATNEKDEEIINHLGYHWLAYDWQNLLISCQICNQISKRGNQRIGKGSRFPVIGTHAHTPETLDHEKPLLINPTSQLLDDLPSKHLAINQDGSLQGLTDRGKMCIDVFGLNHRDQLVKQRKKAYVESLRLQAQLKSESKEERDQAIQEIIAIKKGKEPYSIAQIGAVKALKEWYLKNKDNPS